MSAQSASVSEVSSPDWIELVRHKVATMRFGVVQIVVHEGRVTQIECTERTRLGPATSSSSRRSEPFRDD